jgi:hypothetical protein
MEHALELELAHPTLEAVRILLDFARGRLVVLAFGELEQLGGVGNGGRRAVQLFELRGKPGAFAAELTGFIGVLPDGWIFQLARYLFEAFFLGVVLKETP